MARPFKHRKVVSRPLAYYFKPGAAPLYKLKEITLQLDEFQAIKYAELNRKNQTDAAADMKISRQTFGNILASARLKLADAVINGKALRIAGGPVKTIPKHWKWRISEYLHTEGKS
ncbi:MAG: hypothetical protein A2X34_04255 [Elusimicrobia bacterium GWC2_51_8]|nr:MAG: hypothetical protein A2X33_00660 [Elusimicrobia bacterium GWA2_51_34]OGR63005.1 MAG: hypothetical protein A2X34_04255 [Elusimicrobia bacterium GWC2_51_8]OGR86225.1 MAG: hypothetical protein A2021_00625 [Elusimicrobia bacterium GWF2_52_66]HAF96383.1 hypothetical protein [Elusimicrobiota bacterium]HCE98569.1 hypothetical protein [Elusimicrobiota bacterium]